MRAKSWQLGVLLLGCVAFSSFHPSHCMEVKNDMQLSSNSCEISNTQEYQHKRPPEQIQDYIQVYQDIKDPNAHHIKGLFTIFTNAVLYAKTFISDWDPNKKMAAEQLINQLFQKVCGFEKEQMLSANHFEAAYKFLAMIMSLDESKKLSAKELGKSIEDFKISRESRSFLPVIILSNLGVKTQEGHFDEKKQTALSMATFVDQYFKGMWVSQLEPNYSFIKKKLIKQTAFGTNKLPHYGMYMNCFDFFIHDIGHEMSYTGYAEYLTSKGMKLFEALNEVNIIRNKFAPNSNSHDPRKYKILTQFLFFVIHEVEFKDFINIEDNQFDLSNFSQLMEAIKGWIGRKYKDIQDENDIGYLRDVADNELILQERTTKGFVSLTDDEGQPFIREEVENPNNTTPENLLLRKEGFEHFLDYVLKLLQENGFQYNQK